MRRIKSPDAHTSPKLVNFCQVTHVLGNETNKLNEQLLVAAERGKYQQVYLLVHQGIDPKYCRGMQGYTPLHYAAARGHLEIIKILVGAGWDIDMRNDTSETALHLACYHGHLIVVEYLLEAFADINALTLQNESPLFYAARKGFQPIVSLLVRRECDLQILNKYGDVAIDEVSSDEIKEIFEIGEKDQQKLQQLYGRTSECTRTKLERKLTQAVRERILSFLDLFSLCTTMQISYRWHRAADAVYLWKNLGVSRWEQQLSSAMGFSCGGSLINSIHRQRLLPLRPHTTDTAGVLSARLERACRPDTKGSQNRPQSAARFQSSMRGSIQI
uniref:Fbox protein putative n=1 Tax=Albugo laibachii Nc14 TaxID=890382 RepID=F0WM65_9STRA|nr:Fbox protein putative [Albugo laibachii Nc14]|eukprot:CCA22393.1 Fbox protein putative [Albugo laibachii Nc14]